MTPTSIKHKYTTHLLCPYCDFEFSNSEKYPSHNPNRKTIMCMRCGETFGFTAHTQIVYNTYQINPEQII